MTSTRTKARCDVPECAGSAIVMLPAYDLGLPRDGQPDSTHGVCLCQHCYGFACRMSTEFFAPSLFVADHDDLVFVEATARGRLVKILPRATPEAGHA